MNRIFSLFLVVVCVALAVAAQQPISPPKFIPVNIPGAINTTVYGINNSGVMVGAYIRTDGSQHGFAMIGSRVITIDVPESHGFNTGCAGINSIGSIVGSYDKRTGGSRGFLYQNGQFTDIGPAGTDSIAFGINDAGLIVGSDQQHGFVYDGNTYQTLNVPGATTSAATGINNEGLIALQWNDPSGNLNSSIYDGINYTTITVPGAADTAVFGINNLGDVAATWFDFESHLHGAVMHVGQWHKFMVPGSNETNALGINDQDVIVGYSANFNDHTESGLKLIP